MALMTLMAWFLLFVLTICWIQVPVTADECCSKYYEDGSQHEAFWCPTYCCYKHTTFYGLDSGRECCSSFSKRVYSSEIQSSCKLAAWIPAVSSVVGLGILISIGGCIYKVCCQTQRQRHGIMPYGDQANVTVVSSNTQSQMPGGYAYPTSNMPNQPQASWPGSNQSYSGIGGAFYPASNIPNQTQAPWPGSNQGYSGGGVVPPPYDGAPAKQ